MQDTKFLGLFSLTMLVVANMIGAAVFTTSGFALAALGTPDRVIGAWIVGGIVALCGAIGYGAAVRRLTESGGEYLFLSHWVHPAAGCAAGWVSLFAGFGGATALAAMTFTKYVPFFDGPLRSPWIASLLILLFALLHAFARGPGVWLQNLTVVVKLFLIGLIAAASILGGQSQGWQGDSNTGVTSGWNWLTFVVQLNWISLSYSGFNAAVYVAGEAQQAERSVPRAMIIGTLVVTVIYIVLNSIFVFGPPEKVIAGYEDVAARAIRYLAGPTWENVVRTTVALGLVTSVSSLLLAGPRVTAKMAADGVMPELLVCKGATPVSAILTQAAIAMIFVWLTKLGSLLPYLGMTLSISAAGTVAAALLCKDHASPRPSTIVQVAGSIYIGLSLVTAMVAGWQEPRMFLATVVTLGFGFVVWMIRSKKTRHA